MSDERNRDRGAPRGGGRRAVDPDGADRGDDDALLELARLIGRTDGPGEARPSARGPQPAPARAALARQRDALRGAAERGRPADFGGPRAAIPPASHPDFLHLPGGSEYSLAPGGREDGSWPPADRRRAGALPAGGLHDGAYADDDDHGHDLEPFDDEGPPAPRRRRGAVYAVLALAVFGSAAAYGYRTVLRGSLSSGPTPIIRADNSPTKMTPMAEPAADGPVGGPGEQLVRRDEDPVDLSARYRSFGSAAQPPAAAAPAAAGPRASDPPVQAGVQTGLPPAGDTRRVRTVPINADAVAPPRSAARPAAASPPARPAASQAGVPASQAAPARPQRQAAVTPADDSGAASAEPPPGGYVVQLTAVRSEADAQATFRQLQAKYPVLGGRQPLIRRKDQGERGIYFAAQVGPFGARNDADQLCGQLKSAGGTCYVTRN